MMLPINNIVLYKTGIGFFQRKGMLKGKTLKLNFKSEMMNDILASLTILTTNSVVTGVSYESEDIDLQTALEDVLIQLSPEETFLTLIQQLIGCNIELTISSKVYSGFLLGIQELPLILEENIINQKNIVLQKDDGTIINLPVSEINNFKVLDEKMQSELDYFLQKVYESKKENSKTLTIFFDNVPEGGDEVEINYLQEIPAWKCSYRLVFTESNQAMVQGWALADNIMDEDWVNVNLSLVAGLPISFLYDLYSPNWIQRPEVERKDRFDISVTQFEEAEEEILDFMGDMKADMKKSKREKGVGYTIGGGMPVPPPSASPAPKMALRSVSKQVAYDADDEFDMNTRTSSVKVTTESEAAGDFFQYKLGVPITVQRNQSSLVPILQDYIKCNKISVYNEIARKTNPMLTVELENTSDLTFEEGPISLYDGARFIGEAMLQLMKKGEKQRIPYAIDLGITVDKKLKSHSANIHKIEIKNNGVYQYNFYIKEETYTVQNKTKDEPKTVIIEHPIEQNYELFDTVEPFEKTKSYYRFKLNLPENTKQELVIKTRYVSQSIQQFQYVNTACIKQSLKLNLISKDENDYLKQMASLVLEKSTTESELNVARNNKVQIFNDQERLRQNILSLKKSTSESRLRDKYISKLLEQEDQLEELVIKIKELEQKKVDLEEKIVKLMRSQQVKLD